MKVLHISLNFNSVTNRFLVMFTYFSCRGSGEATRIAQQLIMALIKEPEKELSEILSRCGLSRIPNSAGFVDSYRPSSISINTPLPVTAQVS